MIISHCINTEETGHKTFFGFGISILQQANTRHGDSSYDHSWDSGISSARRIPLGDFNFAHVLLLLEQAQKFVSQDVTQIHSQ